MIHIDINTKRVLRHLDRYDGIFMYNVINFDFKPNCDIVFVTLLEHNLLHELDLFNK